MQNDDKPAARLTDAQKQQLISGLAANHRRLRVIASNSILRSLWFTGDYFHVGAQRAAPLQTFVAILDLLDHFDAITLIAAS